MTLKQIEQLVEYWQLLLNTLKTTKSHEEIAANIKHWLAYHESTNSPAVIDLGDVNSDIMPLLSCVTEQLNELKRTESLENIVVALLGIAPKEFWLELLPQIQVKIKTFNTEFLSSEITQAHKLAITQFFKELIQLFTVEVTSASVSEKIMTMETNKDNALYKCAMKQLTTPVMLIDSDLTITYVNQAMLNLFKQHEAVFQQQWPDFHSTEGTIVGSNIERFLTHPVDKVKTLREQHQSPYKREIHIDQLVFEIHLSPIVNDNNEYIGQVIEWQDLTAQSSIEEQVVHLISEAIQGNFDVRIDHDQYGGALKRISENINQLLDAVAKPLEECIDIAQAVSKGDLTQQVTGNYQGQFQQLAQALNTSITTLGTVFEEIRLASNNVFLAAREIAQGNNDLSHRTESQASSLEETASAMEELTSTVQQNSENTSEATKLSNQVIKKATKGGEVVTNAVNAMSDINKSSRKISDILSVIDEIAFQTNILALNAAVEAARAGEQGRGFAVVAAEVRNLAQRSAAAAKEIKGLINDSVDAVSLGTKLVDETGKIFEELVESITEVGQMIADIESASREQTAGISEVTEAVSQMDEMTQRNAALVEEAAASSRSLEEQAQLVLEQLNFFKTQHQPEDLSLSIKSTQVKSTELKRPPLRTSKNYLQKPIVESDDEWEEF